MSTITVPAGEVAARFGELVALAEAGTEVVVEGADGRRARMVPAPPEAPRRPFILNMHPGAMVMAPDFDDYITEEDFLKGNF